MFTNWGLGFFVSITVEIDNVLFIPNEESW
jgi:hypothetical protein